MATETLNRIAKLLAQAEGAGTTEEERESFMAKAQQLAAINAIDLAVARAHQADKTKVEVPEERRIIIGKPRQPDNKWKVALFLAVAHTNDVQVLISGRNLAVWPSGFPSDLEVVERLYTSLMVQMVSAADAALKRGDHHRIGEHWDGADRCYKPGLNRQVFRSNFYEGFVARAGVQLREARRRGQKAHDEATPEEAKAGTALAVRDKKAEAREFHEERSRRVTRTWGSPEATTSHYGAHRAGNAAAAVASYGTEHRVEGDRRGALPGGSDG